MAYAAEYKAVIYSTEHGRKYRYFESLTAAKRWATKYGPAFDMDGAQILQAPPYEVRETVIGYYDVVCYKSFSGNNRNWINTEV